jgi:hypothetical protein
MVLFLFFLVRFVLHVPDNLCFFRSWVLCGF